MDGTVFESRVPLTPPRPRHARQLSSKSSLIKALVSPVKAKVKRETLEASRPPTKTDSILGERSHNNVRSPPRARSCHAKDRSAANATSGSQMLETDASTDAGKEAVHITSVEELITQDGIPRSNKENSKVMTGSPRKAVLKPTTKQETKTPRALTANASPRKISDSSAETVSSRTPLSIMKRGARVMAAVAAIQGKSISNAPQQEMELLDPAVVEKRFEAMLSSRNIAPAQCDQMRNLTLRMKIDLVKQHQGDLEDTSARSSYERDAAAVRGDDEPASTKRSRSRGRSFTFSRRDQKADDNSPTKRHRGRSRSRPAPIQTIGEAPVQTVATPTTPRSRSARGNRIENPADYIAYLKSEESPVKLEVGRLHKLRILLRNETVAWVDHFVELDGLSQITSLLHRIMALEWREDHEDQLLHETLLCLKGLCTTDSALNELARSADDLFPALLAMLFDDERKGPAEYSTRAVILNILFAYLSTRAYSTVTDLESRARDVLRYLSTSKKGSDSKPLDFVIGMQLSRPYKNWCKEITNVTREVFWIFLHQINVIPTPKAGDPPQDVLGETATYTKRHFPGTRPPVPAAPYIGGVEWDATTYITSHLDLLNGLIASLPTREARNILRLELRDSGFEKTMGSTLRTCKEKFYGGVHDGLRAWVAAAVEDDWPTLYVCEGPSLEEQAKTARASPKKSPTKAQAPPKLDEIKLDVPKLDLNLAAFTTNDNDNGWLG